MVSQGNVANVLEYTPTPRDVDCKVEVGCALGPSLPQRTREIVINVSYTLALGCTPSRPTPSLDPLLHFPSSPPPAQVHCGIEVCLS